MKYDWKLEKLIEITKNSDSYSEILRKLNIPIQGNNIETLKSKIKEYNINTSHFTFGNKNKIRKSPKELSTILTKNSNIKSTKLKNRLIKEGIKTNLCENIDCPCHYTDIWRGKKIIMQLHHIDGDNTNNEIGNLLMLCPNCHSQTDNYCGSANKKKKYYCPDCGKEISRGSKYCIPCSIKRRIKCKPSLEDLIKSFKEEKTFSGVAKNFNVTETSVRKWFKSYGYPSKKSEIIKLLNIK